MAAAVTHIQKGGTVSVKKQVLVVNSIEPEAMQMIREVSDDIDVIDVADLTRAERKGESSRSAELDKALSTAEIVFALKLPDRLVQRAPNLKWIQTISTGVDRILNPDLVRSPVVITNMSGIHETTMAEFALMLMLMFVKQMPRAFYQQIEGRWKWYPVDVLPGKTAGVVGFGRIGREVARYCRFAGMRVVATHRSAADGDTAENVDLILPLARLHELLAQCDFVVLALPLTAETRNLIGETELAAMKRTARLINVSRGPIVDEAALTRALQEGSIAGAGLDVFAVEPLSPDSPLRHMPNVIMSPHVSGDTGDYDILAARLFAENLRRYLAGEPLLNVVDKALGY